MTLKELASLFNAETRREAFRHATASAATVFVDGLQGSAPALLFSLLLEEERPAVLVAGDAEEAGYLYHDLVQICTDASVLFFPSGYKRAAKYGQPDPAAVVLRTEALNRLRQPGPLLVVTYPDALAEKVIDATELQRKTLELRRGEAADSTAVADQLFDFGFERVDYVYEPGQYAVRGSILDVFSFAHELPYRIDFFGDEIESIRTFEIETQLSKERLDSVRIVPDLQTSDEHGIPLTAFATAETRFLFRDLGWTLERIRSIAADAASPLLLASEEGDTEVARKIVDPDRITEQLLRFRRVEYGNRPYGEAEATLRYRCAPQPLYHKNFDLVAESFARFRDEEYTICILSDSPKQIERLERIFEDRGDAFRFTPVLQTLHEGFVDHDLKRCCFTDHQIFDRFHKYNLKSERTRSGKLALSLKELHQLEPGDYMVHIDHGVGRFGGLVRTPVNGRMQEMVKLVFQHDDLLFVSIHALHKLSKYKGKEGDPPRINRLGTGAWEKMKEKTKGKMKEIARDLIRLYARRMEEKGHAFPPDSYLQEELEASFRYEDTPDQLKCTQDVKRDMERQQPMDRLICGDVGFGKTEIAVRAAFKAVADGKQAAVLVPTTVLAFQHYKTFSERLKNFPVTVEYLSRARKPSEVKQLLAALKEGKIDILIGTHRLIGKDVRFKDLGLLVVDEEQKFGVSVKEKLKELKVNVDTLTLSATPIPRTLQFSLMGARDLSVISTPPPNRYPIQTEVHGFSEEILREAVNFELSRGGQVFIVNNRISQLPELEATVRRLVPDARIVTGHGQMEPDRLEQVILDFANQEYDVLIATTIIESGLDMPNTNTIVLCNAQHFGLSELHQLRGRVGRSNKKAFCYLLAPPLNTLTPDARRRLEAIENFSDLGSGIHIAMQDLDIRGAGNLLGAEQSGFIADVGYETYQKILEEAVAELKADEFADLYARQEAEGGEAAPLVRECTIDSDLELLFPESYIPTSSERIALYQELDKMERESDAQAFSVRLEDRFGRIPPEGRELIRIVSLRRLAKSLGIEKVSLKQENMALFFPEKATETYFQSPAFGKIIVYLQNHPRACKLREAGGKRSLLVRDVPSVETAVVLLQEIASASTGL